MMVKRIFASHWPRKIAQDKGINLGEVKGSGDQGKNNKRMLRNISLPEKRGEKAVSQDKAVSFKAAVAAPI